MNTKRRKTFVTHFFPTGPEPLDIVAGYIAMLTRELGLVPDDPLFPATSASHNRKTGTLPQPGCTEPVAGPIRQIPVKPSAYRLPGANAFRKTLVPGSVKPFADHPRNGRHGAGEPLGHESEMTTFVGYGEVPTHRRAVIMSKLRGPKPQLALDGQLLDALKSLIAKSRRGLSSN